MIKTIKRKQNKTETSFDKDISVNELLFLTAETNYKQAKKEKQNHVYIVNLINSH